MRYINKNSKKACDILYYFFIYAFIGWCIETVYVSLLKGTFVNRGFLWGPVCPIYGFGCLMLIFLLNSLKVKNKLIFMVYAIIITTALEYATSLLLEVLFNISLWDYSKEFFNIQGRICLKFSILWGFGAVIITNIVHPRVQQLILQIPHQYRNILAFSLIICITIDITSTLALIDRFNFDLHHDLQYDLQQVSISDVEHMGQIEEQLTIIQPDFKENELESIDSGIIKESRSKKDTQNLEVFKKLIMFKNKLKKPSNNHIFDQSLLYFYQ